MDKWQEIAARHERDDYIDWDNPQPYHDRAYLLRGRKFLQHLISCPNHPVAVDKPCTCGLDAYLGGET